MYRGMGLSLTVLISFVRYVRAFELVCMTVIVVHCKIFYRLMEELTSKYELYHMFHF